MKLNLKKTFTLNLLSIFLFSFFLCCCSNASAESDEYKADSEYFLALRLLQKGDKKEAKVKLVKAAKNGSPLIARRSAETLCSFGDIQQRIERAENLVSVYQDDDAVFTAAKIFFENKEIGKVLEVTGKIDVDNENDELVSIRLRAMQQRNIKGLQEAVRNWFLNKPLTSFHISFFDDFCEFDFMHDDLDLFLFRTEVYRKNYSNLISSVNSILEKKQAVLTEQIFSDIGKVHLYGSSDFAGSGKFFQNLAEKYRGTPFEFYCWFYAGRLFEKGKSYSFYASDSYAKAVNCTDDLQKQDNARWYLMRGGLQESYVKAIEDVNKYIFSFGDPSYYDDYFDMLSPMLLTAGKYEEIGRLYKTMKGLASKEAVAKYAYIYARLLEEGILYPDDSLLGGKTISQEIQDALETAADSSTDLYYRVMASQRLELAEDEIEQLFTSPRRNLEYIVNPDNERLLNGYASYGLPEKIYPEWIRLGQCPLSEETAVNICRLLQKCSDGLDDYYNQSIRIASRFMNYSSSGPGKTILQYAFPKDYENYVKKYSEEYGVEENVMFALIRSESFFDADVISSAGAVGLCQLMTFTADDVAKRLKRKEYNLTDPETNIEFGAWYLGHLIGRLEGNYLDAFYSYNAGITKVRKWKQSSAFGFGLAIIPEDLFLETLPYAETREYGRKLVSATEMYKWLY